jgi:CRISPR-associated protein Cas5h
VRKELRKLVVFETASPFAFFRKNFTTTNALTFAVIPRSSVQGLVGSILGLSRTDFPNKLKGSKIAVELKSAVRKLNMKYMHINHDWWNQTLSHYLSGTQFLLQKTRAQIAVPASVEFLVNPSYRIYVDCSEEINKQLSQNLKRKQSYYTPCLGASSCLCSLKYIGDFEYETMPSNGGDYLPLSSIIPFQHRMPKIKLEKGLTFATEEDLATHIDNERRSTGTYSVIYSIKPSTILVSTKDIVKVKNEKHDVYVKFI